MRRNICTEEGVQWGQNIDPARHMVGQMLAAFERGNKLNKRCTGRVKVFSQMDFFVCWGGGHELFDEEGVFSEVVRVLVLYEIVDGQPWIDFCICDCVWRGFQVLDWGFCCAVVWKWWWKCCAVLIIVLLLHHCSLFLLFLEMCACGGGGCSQPKIPTFLSFQKKKKKTKRKQNLTSGQHWKQIETLAWQNEFNWRNEHM